MGINRASQFALIDLLVAITATAFLIAGARIEVYHSPVVVWILSVLTIIVRLMPICIPVRNRHLIYAYFASCVIPAFLLQGLISRRVYDPWLRVWDANVWFGELAVLLLVPTLVLVVDLLRDQAKLTIRFGRVLFECFVVLPVWATLIARFVFKLASSP